MIKSAVMADSTAAISDFFAVQRSRLLLVAGLGALISVMPIASAQDPARELLGHLTGSWTMTGHVMNEPVQYHAKAEWVLQGQFISLHMIDTTSPPGYEAEVFIGLDSAKSEFVAHWLDSFGGTGARVVGTGPRSSSHVEIVYPYEEGRFRNLFTYDAPNDLWSLVIESEGKDGTWSVFARYDVRRRR